MHLSWYFQQKPVFKVVVGSVKTGKATVFLANPYYYVLPYLMISIKLQHFKKHDSCIMLFFVCLLFQHMGGVLI